MIYKFILLSDEVDNFLREIHIDPEATFLELHEAILDCVGYTNQISSFFTCNEYWEKEQEITLIEMDTSSEFDNLTMEKTRIEELVSDEGQKLVFVFDYLNERSFFIELVEIIPGKTIAKATCVSAKGMPPQQTIEDLFMDPVNKKNDHISFETDNDTGSDDFDEDELDDLNIDDNYFENQNFD